MNNVLQLVSNGKFETVKTEIEPLHGNQCRVRVSFAGICSSDVDRAFNSGAYHYPLVMGHEISGVVTDQGPDVSQTWTGKSVAVFPLKPCFNCSYCDEHKYMRCINYDYYGSRCDGGFAEFIDVNEWNLIQVPDGIDNRNACLLEPCAVVNHALNQFREENLQKRQAKICIIGAGFLGLIASDLVKMRNPDSNVTITDKNIFKLDMSDTADTVIALSSQDEFEKFELNYKNHFDMVLEATGTVRSINSSIQCIKPGGSIVLMGNMKDQVTLSQAEIDRIIRNEITISGTWNSDYKGPSDDWREVIDLMLMGFNPSKYVTNCVPLPEIENILKERCKHKRGEASSMIIKAIYKNV